MGICSVVLVLSFLCTTLAFLPCKKTSFSNVHSGSFIDSEGYTIQSQACQTEKSTTTQIKPSLLSLKWYNFSETDGVGLDLSWGMNASSVTGQLQGFRIILKEWYDIVDIQYLCLNCTLENNNVMFHYNNFKPAQPEKRYTVEVSSIPENQVAKLTIRIPSCHDNKLKYTKACINIAITRPYNCRNRSFEITYSIPSYYGTSATLRLCEKRFLCYAVPDIFPTQYNLPPTGVRNIILPKELSLNKSYRLEIEGFRGVRSQIKVTPLLQSCVTSPFPTPVIIFFCFFLLALIITLIICIKAKWKISNVSLWLQCSSKQAFEILTPVTSIKDPMKLYLLFVNDNAKHRETVLKFAAFLSCDLQFEVLFELYEQEEVYSDSETWMENCIRDADKIVIVWSPGALERWNSGSVEGDMFTPVLKKVSNIHHNSSKKYKEKTFSVYFDYHQNTVVPVAFRDPIFPCFKLMNQFEELYFQLNGIKSFIKGNKLQDDRVASSSYFNPEFNTYGPALYAAIQEAYEEEKV